MSKKPVTKIDASLDQVLAERAAILERRKKEDEALKKLASNPKTAAAMRCGTWISDKTGKRYLTYKPEKGSSIMFSREQLTDVLTNAQVLVDMLEALKID